MRQVKTTGGRAWELYQKAKQFGRWDPQEIDLSVDVAQWQQLPSEERESIMKLCFRRSPDGPREERLRLLVTGVTHYHGVIEGMIASTAYHGVEEMLAARGLLPGLVQGFRQIRADEGRHISFGMDFLREMAAQSEEYRGLIQERFARYLPAMGPIEEWTLTPNPLQLDLGGFVQYAFEPYQRRLAEIGLADPV
ncbi:MAG: hypothetical protein ACOY93_03630 [Bacillota bacterium]